SELADKDEVARLLSDANANVVDEVFKGLSGGKRSYLYRRGVQVKERRRVLLLGSSGDGFDVYADVRDCGDGPARGWARVVQK
ncbi:MAG: hypothetical protein AABW49_03725, partial [Nanoarchaeota archaeon]